MFAHDPYGAMPVPRPRDAPEREPEGRLLGQRRGPTAFVATLKHELMMRHRWATRAEARQAIFRCIESWYNLKRRHSTLGYISTAVYKAQRRAA